MEIRSMPFQRKLDRYTNKRTVGISWVHWPRCMVCWVEFIFYILNVLFDTFDFEIIIMQRPDTKWCSYFSKLSHICINIQVYAHYVLFCLMHVINDIQRKLFVFKWLIWRTKRYFANKWLILVNDSLKCASRALQKIIKFYGVTSCTSFW